MLIDGQAAIRIQAALALARQSPRHAHSAVPQLIQAIRDQNNWELRKSVALALGSVGQEADGTADPKALSALAGAVKDRTCQVRLESVQALIRLGPTKNPQESQPAIDALTSAIQQKNVKDEKQKAVQVWARVAMIRLDGSTLETNLTPIARALSAPEATVRCAAAHALATMGPAAKSKVPDLAAALQHEDLGTRICALGALAAMGPAAASAISPVEALTHHRDVYVKNAALETLKRIQGQASGSTTLPPANPGPPGRPGGG
jgi:HEAT repeat protein